MTSPLDLITNTKRIQKLEELLAEAYADADEVLRPRIKLLESQLAAEREACAKVCEEIDMEVHGVMPVRAYMIAKHCATAIRERSKER